jgi:hypothetical protein
MEFPAVQAGDLEHRPPLTASTDEHLVLFWRPSRFGTLLNLSRERLHNLILTKQEPLSMASDAA